ncbi:MAG: ARPP-1 family domain-containing protein [Candidatus Sericytochromatia bacterium]
MPATPARRLSLIAALGLALVGAAAAPVLATKPVASPQADLKGYLGRLKVLPPETHDGLAIYPLVATADYPLANHLTLDEALQAKALKVTELTDKAEVNTLLLENVGAKPIFIMAGEILRGAKQDRTMQSDLLIPPKSGKLKVSVFCTEHGRWAENSDQFASAGQAVPNSVRQAARIDKNQRAVWSSISDNQSRLKAAAPTEAAKDVYENQAVQKDMQPFVTKLGGLTKRHAHVVGVIAAHGDRLIAVDVFGDDHLFGRLYPKLLRSYAVDVLNDKPKGAFSAKDASLLLAMATGSEWVRRPTEGVGTALELTQKRVHGSALLDGAMAIHADVFEGEAQPQQPTAREAIPNVQQRRNR